MRLRIALISDIHANLEALKATLKDLSARNVDRIVCLGDVVGYNANPNECVELLQKVGVICVAGNHDRAAAKQIPITGFPYKAAKAIRWTRRHLSSDAFEFLKKLPTESHVSNCLVAVHGALHPEKDRETVRLDNHERRYLSFQSLISHPTGARVCAFGHTHELGIFELRNGMIRELKNDQIHLASDGWYLINPGTIGQPRAADHRATYIVLDFALRAATVHRVDYDAVIPLTKTRRAGLLPIEFYIPESVRLSLSRVPQPIKNTMKAMLKALRL
jgi:predicted phosphodiesterase